MASPKRPKQLIDGIEHIQCHPCNDDAGHVVWKPVTDFYRRGNGYTSQCKMHVALMPSQHRKPVSVLPDYRDRDVPNHVVLRVLVGQRLAASAEGAAR